MMLTVEQAAFAANSLKAEAEELQKRAQQLRKRGAGHLPIRPAADLVASAYERAAIELERARSAINRVPS